jgi:hypothetical protein
LHCRTHSLPRSRCMKGKHPDPAMHFFYGSTEIPGMPCKSIVELPALTHSYRLGKFHDGRQSSIENAVQDILSPMRPGSVQDCSVCYD